MTKHELVVENITKKNYDGSRSLNYDALARFLEKMLSPELEQLIDEEEKKVAVK